MKIPDYINLAPLGLPDDEILVCELSEQKGIPAGWYAYDFDERVRDFVLFSGPEHRHSKESALQAAVEVLRSTKGDSSMLQLIVHKTVSE